MVLADHAATGAASLGTFISAIRRSSLRRERDGFALRRLRAEQRDELLEVIEPRVPTRAWQRERLHEHKCSSRPEPSSLMTTAAVRWSS